MNLITLSDRSVAAREPVLCLHSSTASGGQWRGLREALDDRYRVCAPDLYGYGDAPDWNGPGALQLADEVRRLERLITAADSGVHLVGHSYGGAVALRAALMHPGRVHSVTVYEPVLFGLLEQYRPGSAALAEVWAVASSVLDRLGQGAAPAAAQAFVDYWNGPGSWAWLPAWQQAAITRRIGKTAHDFSAAFADPMTLDDLARLPMPLLCLHGGNAPLATRTICHLLAGSGFVSRRIERAGHLGPLTHGVAVNREIEAFLDAAVPPARSVLAAARHAPAPARTATTRGATS